jgi:putative sterol carrier protein
MADNLPAASLRPDNSVATAIRGVGMTKYTFLSDEWMANAKSIRDEYQGKGATPPKLKMNQVITDVPFGEGTLHVHIDTSNGEMVLESGHLDAPEVTVTVDYATARAILVDNNAAAAMQAFMSGKIKIQGDMTKLMALQAGGLDPNSAEVARRVQDITE